MSNDLTITTENLSVILHVIQADGCSVLRIDEGNGCAGAAWIKPEDVTEIDADEVIRLEDAPTWAQEQFGAELAQDAEAFGELTDYSHVAIKRDGNGWTGYFLLWIP